MIGKTQVYTAPNTDGVTGLPLPAQGTRYRLVSFYVRFVCAVVARAPLLAVPLLELARNKIQPATVLPGPVVNEGDEQIISWFQGGTDNGVATSGVTGMNQRNVPEQMIVETGDTLTFRVQNGDAADQVLDIVWGIELLEG